MTKQAAMHEAERYVAKLVKAQDALGYKHPSRRMVRTAVDEAAEAVRTLSALASSSTRSAND